MWQDSGLKMDSRRCDSCDAGVEGYSSVHCGSLEAGYRDLCIRCFNTEMAQLNGLDFHDVEFEPIEMADQVGTFHRFYFRLQLFGDRLSLESFELIDGVPGGYQFQMIGSGDADAFDLAARLTERMRRALSRQHLTTEAGHLSIADSVVRGQIDWSPEGPLVVVDGQTLSWEQFGRLMMTYEGWQFKLQITDRSEEI